MNLKWLLLPGLFLILLSGVCELLYWHINLTPSMPMGIWRETHQNQIERGSFISFCLKNQPLILSRGYLPKGECPNRFAPLLKQVVAIPGDHVIITLDAITVNGKLFEHSATLQKDSKGRLIPFIPRGTYVLKKDEYWVLATDHPNSVDSRYFGAIDKNTILHTMSPVWIFYHYHFATARN